MSFGSSKVRVGLPAIFLATACAAVFFFTGVSFTPAEGPNAIQSLPGCTANELAANDDDSSEAVDIGFNLNFFGSEYSQLYVNNNGNVSFDSQLYNYTPFDFTSTGEPIIAPFLADIDTRGEGSPVVTYGQTTVSGKNAFCVNWVNVGHYSQRLDKRNSIQLLIIQEGSAGDFDLVFNYDKIKWETGDASNGVDGLGGISAAVGYASGDGDPSHHYVRAGSYQNGALLDSNSASGLIHGTKDSGGQNGRYRFEIRNTAPTGASLSGVVTSTELDWNSYSYTEDDPVEIEVEVATAPVEICKASGGSCVTRLTNSHGVYRVSNMAPGTYVATAHDPTGAHQNGVSTPVVVSGTSAFTRDIHLGDPVHGPPSGTTITNNGTSGDGVPSVIWSEPLDLVTHGCAGGTATYQVRHHGSVIRSGPMVAGGGGQYHATINPLTPNTGFATVTINIDCPGAVPDSSVEFGIYIDPSGVVKDEHGDLVEDAEVSLYRASDANGPFIFVPDGSVLMSPSNRENPSYTDSDGRFGWDVVAGFYKVSATKEGCTTAETGVMEIPPPVTDLDIRINCSGNPDPDPDPDPDPTCETKPSLCLPDPPVAKAAVLRLSTTSTRSAIKLGKAAKVSVTVFNDGALDASGVQVCPSIAKKLRKVLKLPKCKSLSGIPGAASKSATFKIKTIRPKKKKAKRAPKKAKIKLTATAGNALTVARNVTLKFKQTKKKKKRKKKK